MELKVVTFWLYYGKEVLTGIRLPDLTPDHEVIKQAIEQHNRIPLCYPESPYSFTNKLRNSRVCL